MADHPGIQAIEEEAALFALGALSPDEAHSFQQRLAAGCPVCRGAVRYSEEALAALALAAPVIEPPPGLRDKLLQQVASPAPVSAPPGSTEALDGLIVRADETPWETSPVPGIEVRNLLQRKTMLVRMAPRAKLPRHRHERAEQCLVLEGSITADGVTAYAGDYTYMPAGSLHEPLYSETGCLLLIAYT